MAIFHVWRCDLSAWPDAPVIIETRAEDNPPETVLPFARYTCVLSYRHEPFDHSVWHDVALSAVELNSWELAHAVNASMLRMLYGGEWWTAEGKRLWDKL